MTIMSKKTLVEFKVLNDDREIAYEIVPIYHNFEVVPEFSKFGIDFPKTSVEEQVMEMLDTMDKTDMMNEHGWYLIIDYEVASNKSEYDEFVEFCKPIIESDPLLNYAFERICMDKYNLIFGLHKSISEKFMIVLSHYDSALKAVNGYSDVIIKQIQAINERFAMRTKNKILTNN